MKRGFTIVELLVVIVVIGILASLTIVAYAGISQMAIASTLQSDLSNSSKQLKLYQAENGAYPDAVDDCPSPAANNVCLDPSGSNTYEYQVNNSSNPQRFRLIAKNGDTSYSIDDNSSPIAVVPITCPAGYIVVPGSLTYDTDDFCVMKYEAKNVGGIATSQVADPPWVNISFATSVTTAAAACSGCHMITENEWLTIAQNVLSVDSNWDDGAGTHVVGTGYIYRGHSDTGPNNALAATSDDGDGYYLTTNTAPSNQRRTLTLTNGEVIWDFSGNVWEWTNATIAGGQPGVTGGGSAWREWTAITNPGVPTPSTPNPSPTYTGITGASSWNSSYGVGQIYSNADISSTRVPLRGGAWQLGGSAGVLCINYTDPGGPAFSNGGFRVAK
jgi:prepilin-type N-terminal cleavage/methylation domain-containing protein